MSSGVNLFSFYYWGVFSGFVSMYIIFGFIYKVDKDASMLSPYECGFESMIKSRVGFSYRFFLISILFLIFDVEIALMLPLPYEVGSGMMMIGVMFFMTIMIGGLVYEYYNGVLSWTN